jgi:hypothetical protein
MFEDEDGNITTGDVSGTGIVIGTHNRVNVNVQTGVQKEVLSLLEELRHQIETSTLPEGTRNVLVNRVLPDMQAAAKSPQPAPGVERGLSRLNDQLEAVGTTAQKVQGIIGTAAKIASAVGLGIHAVAPFLGSLL